MKKYVTLILAIIATGLVARLTTYDIVTVQTTTQDAFFGRIHTIRLLRPFINGVRVTIYNATREQCDETPGILADGTRLDYKKIPFYRYAAISRDLHSRWGGPYDFGDTIILGAIGKHSGPWIVKDIMNARFRKSVDLLVPVGTANVSHIGATIYGYKEFGE